MTGETSLTNHFLVIAPAHSALCSKTETLPAHPEVKMVGVSRIVFWTQRVAEIVATVAQQRRQPGPGGLAAPALQNADASAVGEAETADVQRVRRGVFTAPRLCPMVDIATGKAAKMIDLAQIARHQLAGQRLRLLLDIQRTAQRQRALARKLLLSFTGPKFATRTTLRRGQFPRCRPPAGWR